MGGLSICLSIPSPSVRRSVGPSVGPFVNPSICPSIGPLSVFFFKRGNGCKNPASSPGTTCNKPANNLQSAKCSQFCPISLYDSIFVCFFIGLTIRTNFFLTFRTFRRQSSKVLHTRSQRSPLIWKGEFQKTKKYQVKSKKNGLARGQDKTKTVYKTTSRESSSSSS